MTKKRLAQYVTLQKEIIMLQGQILAAELSGEDYLHDVVQGSTLEAPYSKHTVAISGYGSRAVPKLRARKAKHEAECDAIEKYIESVKDSALRQLLTRRFIEGKTIKETAALVGYSVKQAGRLINDFFDSPPAA